MLNDINVGATDNSPFPTSGQEKLLFLLPSCIENTGLGTNGTDIIINSYLIVYIPTNNNSIIHH